MAQVHLKWDQLPPRWRDITAFLPRVATIMGSKFLPSDGYDHQLIGRTEYRVRRGFFHGLDVRVWRQGEDLIINVSPGSRLSSLLPVVAAATAASAIVFFRLTPDFVVDSSFVVLMRRSIYGSMAVGTLFFLVHWGLMALLTRSFVGQLKKGCDERSVLAEIQRGFSPET